MMVGGLAPFSDVRYEDFLPAVQEAAIELRANLKTITENPDAPTFANTILALENSSDKWDRVAGIYSVFRNTMHDAKFVDYDKAIRKLDNEISSERLANKALFARVRAVWEQRESLKSTLSAEDIKIIENHYDSFASEGAALDDEKQKELEVMKRELADAGAKYRDNLNAENERRGIWITDERELEGIPAADVERALASARKRSEEPELMQWFFSVQMTDYLPVMKFAKKTSIKKRLFIESNKVGTEGTYDNRPLVRQIVGLRYKIARLLGYPDYAAYQLRDRMAKDISHVEAMHTMVIEKAIAKAKEEWNELNILKKELSGSNAEVEPYELSYYTERALERQFQFKEESLKPYFKLESVLEAVYRLAENLYGIHFEVIADAPVYHPDVKALRVKDQSGKEIAIIYCDYFARPGKRQGAWQGTIRSAGAYGASQDRESAHISLNTNFAPSVPGKPTLLRPTEVRTIFHEFGHALHTLLSRVKYKSIAGTSVPWDFVEVPSQFNERFAFESEFMRSFAHHHESGEAIDAELLQRFLASRNYRAASKLMGQVKGALLDLAWHSGDQSQVEDIEAFENELIAPLRISQKPPWPGSIFSTDFAHIFSGGYAAGYYSYLWSEIIAADVYTHFQQAGSAQYPVLGASLCEKMLSRGGSTSPSEMVQAFLGRDFSPDAFLSEKGLLR